MSSLRKLQLGFADALHGVASEAFTAEHVVADTLDPARRLMIYRNNVFAGLTKALRTSYPVVDRLVGCKFFDFAASQFIEQYPSRSGNLDDYGAEFPKFLAELPKAADLRYLPDVARLEWDSQCVFNASEHAPLDARRLAQVPPDRYPQLRFTRHPATRLLASDFPVHRIWQVNQLDYDGDQSVNLRLGGVMLLIKRSGYRIAIVPLNQGEWTFLNALSDGCTLAQTCDLTFGVDPNFDIRASLQQFVTDGVLIDFFLP